MERNRDGSLKNSFKITYFYDHWGFESQFWWIKIMVSRNSFGGDRLIKRYTGYLFAYQLTVWILKRDHFMGFQTMFHRWLCNPYLDKITLFYCGLRCPSCVPRVVRILQNWEDGHRVHGWWLYNWGHSFAALMSVVEWHFRFRLHIDFYLHWFASCDWYDRE